MSAEVLQLIGGLGASTAAVAVVGFFLAFMGKYLGQQSDHMDKLYGQYDALARERDKVIHDFAVSLAAHTEATVDLRKALHLLTDSIQRAKSLPPK